MSWFCARFFWGGGLWRVNKNCAYFFMFPLFFCFVFSAHSCDSGVWHGIWVLPFFNVCGRIALSMSGYWLACEWLKFYIIRLSFMMEVVQFTSGTCVTFWTIWPRIPFIQMKWYGTDFNFITKFFNLFYSFLFSIFCVPWIVSNVITFRMNDLGCECLTEP